MVGEISSTIAIQQKIDSLIKHKVLNTAYFVHDDQEFVKNNLDTVLALIGSNNHDNNIDGALGLIGKQLDNLISDCNELLKLKENQEIQFGHSVTIVDNKNNFLNDPFGGQSKKEFLAERKEIVLVNRIKHSIASLVDVCKQFNKLYEAVNNTIPVFLQDVLMDVENEITSFRRLRNLADNAKTEDIFNHAVKKYKTLEDSYRSLFFWGIAILLVISICLFLIKFTLVPNLLSNVEFWAIKISVIAVGITLISYFLKQSSHYQRLADQNYQTQVELQAYPSFMESIPMEEAASVRKELALKYFGRELDHTHQKDVGNLLTDQMKATAELAKAATDLAKTKSKAE
ncbi:hypothetical protein [Acinetobacter venetianus]|uniref:hypothetical protein n=1 Tax=Acinetobacter venetianus TaxID=52133 RepID=UPI00384CEEF6